MKRSFCCILGFLLFHLSHAQSQGAILKYARQIIDTLSSPSMHGRGYVNKGDSIAADYIKKEFEKIGVKSVGKEFYQRFFFSVNTFPKVDYRLYTKEHPKAWKFEQPYFLVNPSSPSIKGKFRIVKIDTANFSEQETIKIKSNNKYRNNFLLIDTIGFEKKFNQKFNPKLLYPPIGVKGILLFNNPTNGKEALSWHVSQTQMKFPIIEIASEDFLRKIKIEINARLITDYQSQNVLGYLKGTQYPDSFIVFSAHYDHLGRMGKDVYFPGANDNASGCAMLLSLAKYYSEHPPRYSVAFMAFGAEEVGLLGSKHYVENPLFPLKQIKFLVNMDIMGTGDEGIKVVNATEHKKEFEALVKINEEKKLLPSIQPRGKAKNSDHYFFEEAGVKTFFIYTLGGIKAYHDIYDRPETLPLTKFEETFKLLTEFSEYLQK